MFVGVGGLPSRGRLEWELLVAGTHILIKMDECVSKHFFTYIYNILCLLHLHSHRYLRVYYIHIYVYIVMRDTLKW